MVLTAGVGETDAIANIEPCEQAALDPEGEADIVWSRLGRGRRGQPNPSGSSDATEDIPIGRQSYYPPALPNGARA